MTMLNKHCPTCRKTISRDDLTHKNTQKDYIGRKPINCPHCEQLIQLPSLAEKLISIGLLFSVIIAPLNFYWFNETLLDTSSSETSQHSQFVSSLLFGLGILFIILGAVKNKPEVVETINLNTNNDNSKSDIVNHEEN